MSKLDSVKITALKPAELPEADRIFRLAFGTHIGLPDPMAFAGDRQFVTARRGAKNVTALAARLDGRLIGANFLTRWGSFGYFGPLIVLPEFWNQGIAQQLLEATIARFDRDGLTRTGLFTFPHSTKHVGLYRKFGYWPQYLTALMKYQPVAAPAAISAPQSIYLSQQPRSAREKAIADCLRLTTRIEKGLELSDEIRSVLAQRLGEVILNRSRGANHANGALDSFAICHSGAGSEGGTKLCYVKFAAVRPADGTGAGAGKRAGERFDQLLHSIDAYALRLNVPIEAGVNFANDDAARRMHAHGYRAFAQGVAMQRPHAPGFLRPHLHVLGDWR